MKKRQKQPILPLNWDSENLPVQLHLKQGVCNSIDRVIDYEGGGGCDNAGTVTCGTSNLCNGQTLGPVRCGDLICNGTTQTDPNAQCGENTCYSSRTGTIGCTNGCYFSAVSTNIGCHLACDSNSMFWTGGCDYDDGGGIGGGIPYSG